MHGQGIEPESWSPLIERFPVDEMQERLDRMHHVIGRAAEAMPSHSSFLAEL